MKSPLFKSRKFLIMLVNVIISVATYFVTKYVNPEAAKDVLFLIGAMQPVVLAVIASITVQNVEYIKAASVAAETKAFVTNVVPSVAEETPQ